MLGDLLAIAIPVTLAIMATLLVEIVNLRFVGHFGSPEEIAGVGLANMYINLICLAPILGLNATLQTLVP